MKARSKTELSDFPEMDALADQVGEFIQYWGFKRIHGKIWTHLYLSQVPLDATTLVKRIRVSKALVSFSIHDLLEYKVIREVAKGRGRTVLYEACPDVTTVILEVLKMRELKMLAQVATALRTVRQSKTADLERLKLGSEQMERLSRMVGSAQHLLDFLLSAEGDPRDLFEMLRSKVP